ncbi:TIM barrel protein [Microbacterium pseudoresistens]|uniref:TIM barrel protein n=1 Tax=Microbacterium pseudoresistens TaxID=640634 RepID=UPI0031E7BDEE
MRSRFAAAFSVNCSILFPELPMLSRPAAARAAGFDAVEFWWPFDSPAPSARQVDDFAVALDDAGVTLTSLGLDHGDLANGDRGIFASAARGDRLRRNVDAALTLGERTGCRTFVGLYGVVDSDDASAAETAVRQYSWAAGVVADAAGEIVIEPMSGVPGYGIRSLGQAAEFIERVREVSGVSNLGVLADLFHLIETEPDISASLRRHASFIRYAQIADRPGRGVPGSGGEPLADLLLLLEELGYTGPVGLEFAPSRRGTAADLAAFRDWAGLSPVPGDETHAITRATTGKGMS